MGAEEMVQWTKCFLHAYRKKTSTHIRKKKERKTLKMYLFLRQSLSQLRSPGWPGAHYANTPFPINYSSNEEHCQ